LSPELTKRIVFGVIAAPVAIAIVLYGGAPLAALLAVTAALGAWELFRIARASGLTPLDDIGIALAGLVPLGVHAHYLGLYDPNARHALGPAALVVLVPLVLLAIALWARGVSGKPLSAVAVTVFGIVYTGGALSYGYAIRVHEYAFAPSEWHIGSWAIPSGGLLLLLPMLTTWASDTGAYAFGRTFGKRKLIPAVSPGKTVEGSIGGLIASMFVAWLYARYVLAPSTHLGFIWRPYGAIGFGLLVSVAAQVGDLAESLLKREGGVKDSSTLLPGHGGILDRFDSLLFVLPVSYVIMGWLLTVVPA
jgi:phosphatidate cytidylyltransferase